MSKPIIFKCPDELYEKILSKKKKGETLTDFMLNILNYHFSGVPKVVMDNEGTVIENPRNERTIDLDQKIYAEFKKDKLDSVSMEVFANTYIWGKLQGSKKWFEQNAQLKQTNSSNGSPSASAVQTSAARVLYWRKRFSETESWDEAAIKDNEEGVMSDPLLTEKDRNSLTQKRR